MLKYLGTASLLALTLAGAASAHEEGVTAYRVFVGDHEAGRVTAFDLSAPDTKWTFETAGQTKLYPVAGGAVVAAVQSDNDQVNFIASGISLHDHGDHADIEITDPAAIDATLTGPRPFHLMDHDGKVTINYDNGGYSGILDGHELSHGDIEESQVKQNRAHHGVVVPWGDGWLSSVASDAETENGALPPRVGLQAVNTDGTPAGDLQTCTGLHGEAFSGAYLVVGCKEGVLSVTKGEDGPEYAMIPYPADFPQDVTAGTFLGSKAIQMFLANHGANGLAVIDPVDEPHMRRIELPFRRVDFALNPAQPSDAYVLTEDGQIHRIDMLNAKIDASAKVTGPYSMDGHWNDARPRIALAGDEIVVTDPAEGLVRRISTKDLSEIGTVAVEGLPYNITVAGGSGLQH